jgi:hypothetical protein
MGEKERAVVPSGNVEKAKADAPQAGAAPVPLAGKTNKKRLCKDVPYKGGFSTSFRKSVIVFLHRV